jgi:hypothetical protein
MERSKANSIQEDESLRDKYIAFMTSNRRVDIRMTEAEERAMERIDFADDLMRNHPTKNPKEFVKMVAEKFDITAWQARNDINDAMYIYGTTLKPVKAYERMLMKEKLLAVYDKAKGDTKTLSSALYALELLIKIGGLDKPDEDEEEREARPTEINISFKPELLGVELPQNVDELVKQLQARTKAHKDLKAA